MARNGIFEHGNKISLPVTAGTKSGSPVIVGALVGVAETDCADSTNGVFGGGNPDGYASVVLDSVREFTVAGAIAGVGTPVYIKPDYTLTADSGASGAVLYGYALATKPAAAAPIPVKIARV